MEGGAPIHLTGYFMPEYEMGEWAGASPPCGSAFASMKWVNGHLPSLWQ